ncbi:MAG: endolytic transglycosylase MltG [Longimicrobiales bacterium]|nr:endolytic transglycosylase MltG [Longimicrobiales bacterium]
MLLATALVACSAGDRATGTVEVRIPPGAGFAAVTDSLHARGLVDRPGLFTLYARMRGVDRQVQAGRYRLPAGASWREILEALTRGAVVPERLVVPEGWTLRQMAPRIAHISQVEPARVEALLLSDSLTTLLSVPGPGLEGYLLPDTYLLAEGTPPEAVAAVMVGAYHAFWTPERQARLDSLGMDRRELTTLASIVQAEAGNAQEMPLIAAVYHNRLREGWLLQADPTVLYALGGPRERLLFSAIDSVADSPYNTYRRPGLPPGPIGAPGRAALEAALNPADVPHMYMVAGPDGGHVFSTTLAEHNRAVAEYRRRTFGPDSGG